MPTALRPIGHEERLSLVEHLDELRTRLVVSALALAVAFGFALWQNKTLIDVANRPLEHATSKAAKHGRGPLGETQRLQRRLRTALAKQRTAFERLARSEGLSAQDRAALRAAARANEDAIRAVPVKAASRTPVTLGISEPFTATLTIAGYFAFLLALPVILYQLYAFVLPAFSPSERRVALPLMTMAPLLFVAGVVFGYFLVLPAAVGFLQNFNSSEFDILVQARTYYSFTVLTLVSLGILFQIPIGVLALTRLRVMTPRQLRRNRRYAIVIIAVVAMLLPGTDPVTTLIEMVPLLVLYELSIVLASVFERRAARPAEDATLLDQG